jgi:hypothetical protein
MMYVRYPLSLRQVEDLLHERGIDICHETVRAWWNRFGPIFAADIRRKRSASMLSHNQWRWHLDEVFVRINGKVSYLWRAVDHEREVLEVSAQSDETIRPSGRHRDGPASILLRGDEDSRKCRPPGDRALAQQSGREFTSAIPTTRASDGELQDRKVIAEIRFDPRLNPQSPQSRTSPLHSRNLQTQSLHRHCRAASTCGLRSTYNGIVLTDSLSSDTAVFKAKCSFNDSPTQ